MSINPDTSYLYISGLSISSSFAINLVSNPLCSLKNRYMAHGNGNQSNLAAKNLSFIGRHYKGFRPAVLVDTVSIFTAYLTDNALKESISPLYSSLVAGAISSPVAAIGEGLAANRQAHDLPYSQVIRRVMKFQGVVLTIARDAPYTCASFYLSKKIQSLLEQQYQLKHKTSFTNFAVQAASGGIAGLVAGTATTPVDFIKVRIQTSPEPLSIANAARQILAEKNKRKLWPKIFLLRGVYIAVAVSSWNVADNAFQRVLKLEASSQ